MLLRVFDDRPRPRGRRVLRLFRRAIEPRPVALKLRRLPLKPRITPLKLGPGAIAHIIPPQRRRVVARRNLAMSPAGPRMALGAPLSLLSLQALHNASDT